MNYSRIYNDLIAKRVLCPADGEYYETHHILPRSLGGTNDPSNLVRLTAREHFIAHWMLWKIDNNTSMAYAFGCMRTKRNASQEKFRYNTSHGYEAARRAVAYATSKLHKGKKMHSNTKEALNKARVGSKHTAESKSKMRDAHLGKHIGADNNFYGKSHSVETKARISSSRKGKNKGTLHPFFGKTLTKEHKEKLKASAVGRNKGLIRPKVKCPHCDKVGGNNLMKRYHFDKCKSKQNQTNKDR